MSTLVTDRPKRSPRLPRTVYAATWAAVGAVTAAGGWVAGLILARSLLDVQLFARDLPADQLASTAVRLAGIGGVWGLLAGLAAGLVQPGDRGLSDRIAGTAMRAVGGLVVGLIGGALAPLAASFGRALPVEVSSALGWAFAGTLAGLVAYGWTQVREKPVALEDEPDGAAEPVPSMTGEGWPRSLYTAAKWALGGAVAAAGWWTVGLLVGEFVLQTGPFVSTVKGRAAQAAFAAAQIGGGIGLIAGLAFAALRGGGRYADRGALGAVGGALVGLTGGGLAPLLASALRGFLPVEAGSALAWAFVGLLAGLVAYGWKQPVPGTLAGDVGPPEAKRRSLAAWAAGGAVAAVGAWVLGLTAVRYGPGIGPLELALRNQPAETAAYLAAFGGGWGVVIGAIAGLMHRRLVTGAVGGMLVGLIGGSLAPLLVNAAGSRVSLEVSTPPGWAFAGTLAGLVAYRSTRPKSRPGKTSSRQVGPTLGLAALAVASAFAATAGVLPEQGRWAAGGVALGAVAVLAALVAWVVAAQDRRMRELERTIREWEADDDEIATTIRPDPFNSP